MPHPFLYLEASRELDVLMLAGPVYCTDILSMNCIQAGHAGGQVQALGTGHREQADLEYIIQLL